MLSVYCRRSELKSVYLGVTERKPSAAIASSDFEGDGTERTIVATGHPRPHRLLVSVLLDRVELAQQEKCERKTQTHPPRIAEQSSM